MTSRLAEPMMQYCRNLTMQTIKSGHWMAQEKPFEVSAALVEWLVKACPDSGHSRRVDTTSTCMR